MAESARSALIVASSDYADPELRQLQTPAADASALEAVLRDPGIGGFEVRTLLNRPNQEVILAVEEFFADREPDDMLLAHFSCHGIKDEDGELYFAMPNSRLNRLASTAVAANFVNQRMNRSRSRRVVLLLDCCYAGAFERGMMARAAGMTVGIEGQFAGGRGRAVITASDAMQYAYEGGELAVTGSPVPSVFSSALVNGLKTGEADRDQDGHVALDELYDYIYETVQDSTPNQTPCKWTYGIRGELFIARRSLPVTTPSPLPDDIRQAIESRLASVRLGAVQELELLLRGRHQGLALAARLALDQLTDDDSRTVSAAATAALGTEEPPAKPPGPEPPAAPVDFAPPAQRGRSAPEPATANSAPAEAVPADTVPVAERFPRPDTAPREDEPAPSREGAATEMVPHLAPSARSAVLLNTGFGVLAAVLIVIGLNTFVPAMHAAIWPWWAVLIACIGGIGIVLGALRRYPVYASTVTWLLGWTLIWAVSIISVWNSEDSTALPVLGAVSTAGAVVTAGLCVWVIVLQARRDRRADPFLAILLGCVSLALVLVAFPSGEGRQPGPFLNAAAAVAIAAALVVPLTLMRAHRSAGIRS